MWFSWSPELLLASYMIAPLPLGLWALLPMSRLILILRKVCGYIYILRLISQVLFTALARSSFVTLKIFHWFLQMPISFLLTSVGAYLTRNPVRQWSFQISWRSQRVIRLPQRKVFGGKCGLNVLIRAPVVIVSRRSIKIRIALDVGWVSSLGVRWSIGALFIWPLLNTPCFNIRIQIWAPNCLWLLLNDSSFASDWSWHQYFWCPLLFLWLLRLNHGPYPFLRPLRLLLLDSGLQVSLRACTAMLHYGLWWSDVFLHIIFN